MDGVDVTRRSPQHRARRGLARTFQRMELFTELTVREHLVVARRVQRRAAAVPGLLRATSAAWASGPDPARTRRSSEILALLGLDAVADRPAVSVPLGTGRLVEVGARARIGADR